MQSKNEKIESRSVKKGFLYFLSKCNKHGVINYRADFDYRRGKFNIFDCRFPASYIHKICKRKKQIEITGFFHLFLHFTSFCTPFYF